MPIIKRLFILRHAKAVRDEAIANDFDRPLQPYGQDQARAIGAYLLEQDLLPDRILCSPACRTLETLQYAARTCKPLKKIETRQIESLYLAGRSQLVKTIQSQQNNVASLMVIGHNPGLHDLACTLLKPSEVTLALKTKYPTAGLTLIEFAITDWHGLEPKSGVLKQFIKAKTLL